MTSGGAGGPWASGRQHLRTRGHGCREEGLFPLERFHPAEPPRELSEAQHQRYTDLCEEARFALNYLHGEGHRSRALRVSEPSASKARWLQSRTQQQICTLALEAAVSSSAVGSGAALKKLLRGRSLYSQGSHTSVAGFVDSLVSLLTSVESAPFLEDCLPMQNRNLFSEAESPMVRPAVEVEALDDALGPAGMFHDPRLGSQSKAYLKFVRRCLKTGLVTLTLHASSIVGLFFVTKKNGKLRFIADCRRTNRLFREPPSIQLVTGEGFSKIEVGVDMQDQCLKMGTGDVANCFHLFRLRGWLRHYFCWPPLRASQLGITKLHGSLVTPDTLVYPMQNCLPMGFSWALYLAQRANRHQLTTSVPQDSTYLTDQGDAWVVDSKGKLAHYVYIDNLGILGVDGGGTYQRNSPF